MVVVGIHCEWRVLVVVVSRWWREVKVIGVRGDSWTVGVVGINVRVIVQVLEIIQNVPWLCRTVRVIGGDVNAKPEVYFWMYAAHCFTE